MNRYRYIFFITIIIAALFICSPVFAEPPSEYQVKSAFLYNFAKFIDWPDSAFKNDEAPIRIGILGDNPFGDLLKKTVAGKKIRGRDVIIASVSKVEAITGFNILFISSSENKRLPSIFSYLDGTSVLTIGEIDGFANKGGIINFFKYENKIRFEINNENARKANLIISSKLLKLARIIEN